MATLYFKNENGQFTSISALRGDAGKSAYESYKETVPKGEEILTQEEWIESLKGETGESAFELYKRVYPEKEVETEDDFFKQLIGPEGKSAFQIAKEVAEKNNKHFIFKNEEEWLESFKTKIDTSTLLRTLSNLTEQQKGSVREKIGAAGAHAYIENGKLVLKVGTAFIENNKLIIK